ncbi:type VI secretion system baseplate subunit TssE [Paraburkholderia sp.]|uniref:type VI secretion system baseplate subunit TssE n=1 Tax=Paraburkholderia sp. TaxID=1926495 RepID=UPI003D6FFD51
MPAGPSLYDMLLGHIGGVPLGTYDDRTLEILSIQQNIARVLNTRAGSLKHLPDYGLPDLTNVYQALPASAHLLKKQMEFTLLRYEPRIRAIDIDLDDVPDPGLKISYVMICHLKKAGLVRFGTYFEPPGRLRVDIREQQRRARSGDAIRPVPQFPGAYR